MRSLIVWLVGLVTVQGFASAILGSGLVSIHYRHSLWNAEPVMVALGVRSGNCEIEMGMPPRPSTNIRVGEVMGEVAEPITRQYLFTDAQTTKGHQVNALTTWLFHGTSEAGRVSVTQRRHPFTDPRAGLLPAGNSLIAPASIVFVAQQHPPRNTRAALANPGNRRQCVNSGLPQRRSEQA